MQNKIVWAVKYANDHLDPSPLIMSFDTESEAHDWACYEVERRVQWAVDHSYYFIDEEDRAKLEESEWSLVRIWKTLRVPMKEQEDA